jgi:dihydrofolate reductase
MTETGSPTTNKVILWMQTSLDGYASGPDGAFDWTTVGDELQSMFVERLSDVGTFAYGRNVFAMMSSYWPIVGELPDAGRLDKEFGDIWVPQPKVVFSSTLTEAQWNTTVLRADLAAEVAALKQRSTGDIVVFGGPTLAHGLIRADLIDEYTIFVHPIAIGGGQPLFPPGVRTPLRLLESRVYDGAVTHLQYAAR